MDKWRQDEALGDKATISPVLYANKMHPNLKIEHPDWSSRQKQIQRLWRRISQEDRAPFLSQARENRHKQKAMNSAKNSRQRLGSSGHQDKKKETIITTPVQLPVPGVTQVTTQMAPVATVVSTSTVPPPPPPSSLHQIIQSPQMISASPQQQIIQSPSTSSSNQVESSKSTTTDDWKQFVMPFESSSSSSPKPSASPNHPAAPRVIASPSNSCPSPSTSSTTTSTTTTPLIGKIANFENFWGKETFRSIEIFRRIVTRKMIYQNSNKPFSDDSRKTSRSC